jgi:hypothetical protein
MKLDQNSRSEMLCTAVVLLATLPTCAPEERQFGNDGKGNTTSAGGDGSPGTCLPGTKEICYGGPPETAGVALCKAGLRTCNPSGRGYGPCEGEVLPASELCDTSGDDDCNGEANEGCFYTRCAALPPGSPSGVYLLDPGNTGQAGAHAVYCDMETDGGGWALVYNSIGSTRGTTLPFWSILYADRLGAKGSPSLDDNVYAGWLYPYGHEYRDEVEDLVGAIAEALRAHAAGFRQDDMRFEEPVFVSGNRNIYDAQFASGWSSVDFHGDSYSSNCAVQYANVSQHYSNCWAYNLGADADSPVEDDGWGPHMNAGAAAALGLFSDASAYTRVKRISRWARW